MPTEVIPDDRALREGRRRRALSEMSAHGLDALVLGREANARYVSGAARLWTAGSRPFGPGCVLVRSTGAVHLVSTWDEGIPDDIPHDHLFGITWNPGNLLAWLRGIDGLAEARRIGTDGMTPRFARLLPKLFPSAEFVDAGPALEAARKIKTPEEVEAIRASIAVAERALAAAIGELRPGVSERHLTAVFMDAMASQGVTTPGTQRVARISPVDASTGHWGDRTVAPGDLVSFDATVIASGYSGEVGRTWPADPIEAGNSVPDLYRRADDLWGRLLQACRAGEPCRALLAAYEDGGDRLPVFPVATGLGLGFDVPVVTGDLPETADRELLEPGMALAVTACVTGPDGRSVARKEAVLVTTQAPEVLTSSPNWRR